MDVHYYDEQAVAAILPTHQLDALIMRPGRYRTLDFTCSGFGLTLFYLFVLIAVAWLLYL